MQTNNAKMYLLKEGGKDATNIFHINSDLGNFHGHLMDCDREYSLISIPASVMRGPFLETEGTGDYAGGIGFSLK
jgi:hypothetical protein